MRYLPLLIWITLFSCETKRKNSTKTRIDSDIHEVTDTTSLKIQPMENILQIDGSFGEVFYSFDKAIKQIGGTFDTNLMTRFYNDSFLFIINFGNCEKIITRKKGNEIIRFHYHVKGQDHWIYFENYGSKHLLQFRFFEFNEDWFSNPNLILKKVANSLYGSGNKYVNDMNFFYGKPGSVHCDIKSDSSFSVASYPERNTRLVDTMSIQKFISKIAIRVSN